MMSFDGAPSAAVECDSPKYSSGAIGQGAPTPIDAKCWVKYMATNVASRHLMGRDSAIISLPVESMLFMGLFFRRLKKGFDGRKWYCSWPMIC